MMKFEALAGTAATVRADILALPVVEDKEIFRRHVREVEQYVDAVPIAVSTGAFTGKAGQTLLLTTPNLHVRHILLVGVGKAEALSTESLRRLAGSACKSASSIRATSLVLFEPEESLRVRHGAGLATADAIAQAYAEGAALSAYTFDKYRTQDRTPYRGPVRLVVATHTRARLRQLTEGLTAARVICEAVYLARDLANAPGNEIYPETLAQRARAAGRVSGFSVTVFDEKKIASLGMGGLLGVASGSVKPPRFIVMEHAPKKSRASLPTIVLVGKGVTFDSGGISIKPSANMAEMKMDMSGAAAVIGTMRAASILRLPVRLVGLVPATENLPGGNALKPGDILRHLNGKTSEIDNTDAEGRLILADALSFASRYKPDLVVDLATLTGAVVVALAHLATGMMGTSEPHMQQMRAAGDRTFERVWQLPLFEEYEKLIKSDVADVKNVGGRWGGAITAAIFLKHFIGEYPWIHLDIAGTAILEESSDYAPRGGSGVGVRLLIDFLRHWQKG
jgi:leucyl aminopeptidase